MLTDDRSPQSLPDRVLDLERRVKKLRTALIVLAILLAIFVLVPPVGGVILTLLTMAAIPVSVVAFIILVMKLLDWMSAASQDNERRQRDKGANHGE